MITRNRSLWAFALIGTAVLIASGVWLLGNGPLINLAFPPEDLYKPLASSLLDDRENVYHFEVSHRYSGQYEVVVKAPSSPGIGVSYEMDFIADVVLRTGGIEVLNMKLLEPHSQFWGDEDGGIVLVNYRVPELVPEDRPVHIAISTSRGAESWNEQYGQSKLLVRKRSDK
jgi:hypothetical protein